MVCIGCSGVATPTRRFAASHVAAPAVSRVSHCRLARRSLVLPPRAVLREETVAVSTKSVVSERKQVEVVQSSTTQQSNVFASVAKVAAAAMLAFTLSLGTPNVAEAAGSGGRMGGSSFGRSAPRAMPRAAPRSAPAPAPQRSFSGGVYSAPGGVYSAPRVYTAPSTTFYPSFFFPMWGFGGYGFGGSGLFSTVVLLVAAVFVFNIVQSFFFGGGGADEYEDDYPELRTSVARVQVGLLSTARQLKKDLDRIAMRADPDSEDGLHYILQETVLALQRNPDYCVYGYSDVGASRSPERAEARFNELSLEERSKFREETLVNVGGRSARRSMTQIDSSKADELIVVTILVACEMDQKLELPQVSNLQTLRQALNKLGSLSRDSLMAVEVMWTPQDPNDSYSRNELLADYPYMISL